MDWLDYTLERKGEEEKRRQGELDIDKDAFNEE